MYIYICTLRCLINEAFVKFNKRGAGGLVGFKIDGVFGISRNSLISVMNENRDINV